MVEQFTSRKRRILECPDRELEIVVTDDGSRTLRRKSDQVTWHSESGAVSESELVFLRNGKIRELMFATNPTSVLEIGFGTGLNFWLTASKAITEKSKISYFAVEPRIMSAEIVTALNHGELTACQPAYEIYKHTVFVEKQKCFDDKWVQLRIFDELATVNSSEMFDCIYHDPFSPEFAPELWSRDYFEALRDLLKPERNLVTYCVKTKIQKLLSEVGFAVSKTPGPKGGKREVLIATKLA